jgi:hypothetical protein
VKISQKRKCLGCMAFNDNSRSCDLGYPVKSKMLSIKVKGVSDTMFSYHPESPCPKPKTYQQDILARGTMMYRENNDDNNTQTR